MMSSRQGIPRPETASEGDLRFYQAAEAYLDGMLRLNPTASTYHGFHAYDGLLEDLGPSGVQERVAFYREWKGRFAGFREGSLSPGALSDLQLLVNDAGGSLFALEELRSHESDPTLHNDIIGYSALGLTLLSEGDPAWPDRLASLRSRLKELPGFLSKARQSLKSPARVLTSFTAVQNRGNIEFFRRALPLLFAHAPSLRAGLEKELARALEALEGYQRFLEGDLLTRSTGSWKLGRELWTAKLRYTLQSDMSPDEIAARAWKHITAERQRMLELADPLHSRLFPSHHHGEKGEERINLIVGEVMDIVSKRHSRPDELLRDVREKWVPKVLEFIRRAGILSLPPEQDNFVVERTPGFLDGRAVAFFNPPPAFEPGLKKSFWISSLPSTGDPERDRESAESFLREYNDYGLQNLTMHEAFPGHYVQFYYALNSPYASIYKKIFANSTFAEGWAVLCEEQMFDAGYAADEPECELVHRKMSLRAPINAILDARLHTEMVSDEEADRWAMDLMRRFGFQEEAEADGKLRRAKVTSTQLSTYFVGYLELKDLTEDYRRKTGPAFKLREFNEKLLSYGTIPPRSIRSLML